MILISAQFISESTFAPSLYGIVYKIQENEFWNFKRKGISREDIQKMGPGHDGFLKIASQSLTDKLTEEEVSKVLEDSAVKLLVGPYITRANRVDKLDDLGV